MKSWNAQLAALLPAILFFGGGCSHPSGPGDAGNDDNRICSGPASTKPPVFGPAILIVADGGPVGAGANVSTATGDVNGDGLPDLVESNASIYDTILSNIFLGLADGGLSAPQPFGQSTFAVCSIQMEGQQLRQ